MTEQQAAPATTLTLPTQADIEGLMTASAKAKADAEAIVIDSDDMLQIANTMVSEAHATLKTVEARREEITRPLNAAKASAIAMFRPLEEALGGAKTTLAQKIASYRTAIEKRRRDEEAAAQAAIEAQRAAAAAELAATQEAVGNGEVAHEEIVEKLEAAEQRVLTTSMAMPAAVTAAPSTGGNALVGDWKVEITDLPALLAFLAEDLRAETPRFPGTIRVQDVKVSELKAYAKATKGAKPVPGVTFVEQAGLRVRA